MSNVQSFAELATQARTISSGTRFDAEKFVTTGLLAILTLGLVPVSGESPAKDPSTVAMPDDWLAAVAALPEISPEGMDILVRALRAKGWVSVQEARRFVDVEERVLRAREEASAVKQHQAAGGAAQLMARAERERPGTLDRLLSTAQTTTAVATEVLSFTGDLAATAGRTLWKATLAIRGVNDSAKTDSKT